MCASVLGTPIEGDSTILASVLHTHRRICGFSLIELMVAMCILAILTSLAFPNYFSYVRSGRRAEAQATLLSAALFLQRQYSIQGSYTGFDLSKFGMSEVPNGAPAERVNYRISAELAADGQTFRLIATPVLGDPDCGALVLDETGYKTITLPGASVSRCWR